MLGNGRKPKGCNLHRSVRPQYMPLTLTDSLAGSFVQFAELKLCTVDGCSLPNCMNKFLIGTVC